MIRWTNGAVVLIVLLSALGLFLALSPDVHKQDRSPAIGVSGEQQDPGKEREVPVEGGIGAGLARTIPVSTSDHQAELAESEAVASLETVAVTPSESERPGDNIHFQLSLDESTHHMIRGSGAADTGEFAFESKRLPSNEVELAIVLKQPLLDDVELTAYFDLANFVMELDGRKSILNREQKQLLDLASARLQNDFQQQYEGYDLPEHALMLSQMMAYWSVSPEGYVHEKRRIVSR